MIHLSLLNISYVVFAFVEDLLLLFFITCLEDCLRFFHICIVSTEQLPQSSISSKLWLVNLVSSSFAFAKKIDSRRNRRKYGEIHFFKSVRCLNLRSNLKNKQILFQVYKDVFAMEDIA